MDREGGAKLVQVAMGLMGAPMVAIEAARELMRLADTWTDPDMQRVCNEGALALIEAANRMGYGCCEYHRTGGEPFADCRKSS